MRDCKDTFLIFDEIDTFVFTSNFNANWRFKNNKNSQSQQYKITNTDFHFFPINNKLGEFGLLGPSRKTKFAQKVKNV